MTAISPPRHVTALVALAVVGVLTLAGCSTRDEVPGYPGEPTTSGVPLPVEPRYTTPDDEVTPDPVLRGRAVSS